MSRAEKTDRFSSRLVTFSVLFSVLIALVFTLISYYSQLRIYEEKELAKLEAIVNTLAPSISGDELMALFERYPEQDDLSSNTQDSTYSAIRNTFLTAARQNSLETTLYTMRFDTHDGETHFHFGVSTSDTPFWNHTYHHFPELLRTQYKTGGIMPPYQDENGYWLSAFAPIKDSSGKVISVLQADEKFDSFIMQARKAVFRNLIIALLAIGVIALFMVITVRRIALKQEKLDEEKRELEAMRRDLIANVSHDLRTPLAYIQGYLETLLLKKDDLDPERFEKYLQTSLSGTQRLRNLVDDLFELSKIETGSRKINREAVNLAELIYDVAGQFKLSAAEKKVNLNVDVPFDLPPVSADLALLDRVLQNLVSNSIKYCEERDEVTLEAKPDEGTTGIRISIKDTGPGIAEEDLPHIFDRFRRGDQLHTQGTGLGLAIVKSILDLHECSYEIRSKKRKGTTFEFVLPLA